MATYNTAIRNEQDIRDLPWSDSFRGLILFVFLVIHGIYGDNPLGSECMLVASLNNQGYFKISNDYKERVTDTDVKEIQETIRDISDPSDDLRKGGFMRLRKKIWETVKKGGPSLIGTTYEKTVHRVLVNCMLGQTSFNTQPESELGGSSSRPDIMCNHLGVKDIGVECKNKVEAEYIQLDIHMDVKGDWLGPNRTKRSHPETVVNRYLHEVKQRTHESPLYYGTPPPFPFLTLEEFEVWQTQFLEKQVTQGLKPLKDYRWTPDGKDFILKNYSEKGNHYIQINGYGLYHLGTDPCKFVGVPKFEPEVTELRIRCKRREKTGCIPSSLTISAWVKVLKPSPFSLDDPKRLPKNLVYVPPPVITS